MGGGGKGMRIVNNDTELEEAMAVTQLDTLSSLSIFLKKCPFMYCVGVVA